MKNTKRIIYFIIIHTEILLYEIIYFKKYKIQNQVLLLHKLYLHVDYFGPWFF